MPKVKETLKAFDAYDWKDVEIRNWVSYLHQDLKIEIPECFYDQVEKLLDVQRQILVTKKIKQGKEFRTYERTYSE